MLTLVEIRTRAIDAAVELTGKGRDTEVRAALRRQASELSQQRVALVVNRMAVCVRNLHDSMFGPVLCNPAEGQVIRGSGVRTIYDSLRQIRVQQPVGVISGGWIAERTIHNIRGHQLSAKRSG